MKRENIGLIYFSPTGTTRTILTGIAGGFPEAEAFHVDLTPPQQARPCAFAATMAIIGAPVYAGRVPAPLVSQLQQLEGKGIPAVVVAVYGNRAYDDALLELRDLAVRSGFVPMAAAAFVGEHSFSTGALPIAAGRPDQDDMRKARAFGETVAGMLGDPATAKRRKLLEVPGRYPYAEPPARLAQVTPTTDAGRCTGCGACDTACPTGALRRDHPRRIDTCACIRCCACVRSCPTGAKKLDDPLVLRISEMLHGSCAERREPEVFL